MKLWRRAAALALAGALLGALTACNTVAGFGQDMSEAGHAIKKAAE
jgi:entericidin A